MKNQRFPFELFDEDSLVQIDFWFQKDKLTFAVMTLRYAVMTFSAIIFSAPSTVF